MKKIIILFLVLITLIPTGVSASCAGPFDIQDYRNMADTVAAGTIDGIFFDSYLKFQVERYYKGTGPETIAVRGRELGPDIFSSVDYELENGKTYLLFLKKIDGVSYRTNACAGNRKADTSNTALFTREEALILGVGTAPDLSKDNALIAKNKWGWLIAIVGYGYVLPALLVLALAFSIYVFQKIIRRKAVKYYQTLLLIISVVYLFFYFYIQRVI
ncbi:MAG TPA: hypothetical protein VD998_00755 [Verrucomicrobiae bacterium]|nr:hypothetical protein [Verrucomicrobiae bacterium]